MQNMSHLRLVIKGSDIRQKLEGRNNQADYVNYRSIEINSYEEAQNLFTIKDFIFNEVIISNVFESISLIEQIEVIKECARIATKHGIVKIRVPAICDTMLIDYYGWSNFYDGNISNGAGDYDEICSKFSPKCSFTPFAIVSLARAADLFVTGAFLRDIYFYEINLKKNQSLDFFTSMEIAHNIYFCAAYRVGTTSELEHWARCLDQGMKIEEMIFNIKSDICDFSRNLEN